MTDNKNQVSDATVEIRTADVRGSKLEQSSSNQYFTLTVIEGSDFGCVFNLDKPETTVGRSDEADIKLNDNKASRRHLLLATQSLNGQPKIIVIDLDSKNGTYVNGERISEVELNTSDKVQIGDTILKFEVKDKLDLSYHEKLYQQATRDALTGLCNRGHAQEELEKFIAMSARYNRPFSLLLFDIDFFKSVNDTYGHDVGDAVLKIVAQAINSSLRVHDIAARFGGEEFVVLLPETSIEGAIITAERLRQAIESVDFTPHGCPRRVTVSIGVAQFPICGRTAEQLVKQSDEALYKAKQTGRNRVVIAAVLPEQ